MDFLKELILELGGFVALFAVVEQFLKPDMRHALGRFVFGRRGATFPEFELNTISALVSPFLSEGRLVWRRVFLLSFSVSLSVILFGQLSSDLPKGELGERFWINIASALPTALVAWPCDWWSLRVTKWFFIDRRPTLPKSVLAYLADVAVSILPLLVPALIFSLIVFLAYSKRLSGGSIEWSEAEIIFIFSITISMISNVTSSVFLSTLQLIILGVGALTRAAFQLTQVGSWLAEHTEVESYPLSFIGLLLGIVFSITT